MDISRAAKHAKGRAVAEEPPGSSAAKLAKGTTASEKPVQLALINSLLQACLVAFCMLLVCF